MKLFQKVFKGRSNGGGKEPIMGDQDKAATPPAASGGIDQAAVDAAVKSAIEKAVPGVLAEALKPFDKRLAETETNLRTVADTVANQKPLGEDRVKALLTEQAEALAARTKQEAEAQQASAAIKAERDAYAADHLKNVPAIYYGQLGDDKAQWEANAKAAREKFAADLKAAGVKAPDLGGSAGGEAPKAGEAPKPTLGGVSEGVAKFAESIKLPA